MYANEEHPIRVFVIAPPIMCWALQELVKSQGAMALAGAANSIEEAAMSLPTAQADIVLADVDGSSQSARLPEFLATTQARVLVLTGLADLQAFDSAILAGLQGIVRKANSPDQLVTAIEKVHRGEMWLDRGATGRLFMTIARQRAADRSDPDRAKIALLTRREREAIAALVADTAAPAKVIASRLSMSEHTLRNHLTSIYSKLHVSNRLDLYAYATRHKIEGRVH